MEFAAGSRIPAAGGAFCWPSSAHAASLRSSTSAFSLATLLAAVAAVLRVIRHGPLLVWARAVLRRSVQRVPGRAHGLRRPHDLALFAPLHAHRGAPRPPHPRAPAPLSQHVPALHGCDAARAAHQQHGAAVGGDGSRDALDRAAGVALPHARRASKPHGSTSSCAASASPRRCSARSCCISPQSRCSAAKA